MRKLLYRFAMWLAHKTSGGEFHIVWLPTGLLASAKEVVAHVAADVPNASSENKHARAFALLARREPHAVRRDIGLAIELALID